MPDWLVNLRRPKYADPDLFDSEHYDKANKLCIFISKKMNERVPLNWDLPNAAEAAGSLICMYHPDYRTYPKQEFWNLKLDHNNHMVFEESKQPYDYLLHGKMPWLAIDAKLANSGDEFRISSNEVRVAQSYTTRDKKYIIFRINLTIKHNKYIVRHINIIKIKSPRFWDLVIAGNTI